MNNTNPEPAPATMRELCKGATPGPWEYQENLGILWADNRNVCLVSDIQQAKLMYRKSGGYRQLPNDMQDANAELIARCSPPVMLAVIEALEAAARLNTSQSCPDENHGAVVLAMDALDLLNGASDRVEGGR